MKDAALTFVIILVVLLVAVMVTAGAVWVSNKARYVTTTTTDYIDSRSGQRYIVFNSERGLFVIKAEPDKAEGK